LRTVLVSFLLNANYETDLKMKKDGLRTNCTKYTQMRTRFTLVFFSKRTQKNHDNQQPCSVCDDDNGDGDERLVAVFATTWLWPTYLQQCPR